MAFPSPEKLQAKRNRRAARVRAHRSRNYPSTTAAERQMNEMPSTPAEEKVSRKKEARPAKEQKSLMYASSGSGPPEVREDASNASFELVLPGQSDDRPAQADNSKSELEPIYSSVDPPGSVLKYAEPTNKHTSSSKGAEAPSSGYAYTWSEPISNMEEMRVMKQLTQSPAPLGPPSVTSRHSRHSSASAPSRRSARSTRSTRALEEAVSLTILQTASGGAESAHFLVQEDKQATVDATSTEDILQELLSLSVDREPKAFSKAAGSKELTRQPDDDLHSLYSMPVEDPDSWIPIKSKPTSTSPAPCDESDEGGTDGVASEMNVMRSSALMDDETSDTSSVLFSTILEQSGSQDQKEENNKIVDEADSSESEQSDLASVENEETGSLELAYSSSARSEVESDDDLDATEQARNEPATSLTRSAEPESRTNDANRWLKHPTHSLSDVFSGLDDVEVAKATSESSLEESDSEDSEDEIRSSADRSGAFPKMLETPVEMPGMESEDTETDDEEYETIEEELEGDDKEPDLHIEGHAVNTEDELVCDEPEPVIEDELLDTDDDSIESDEQELIAEDKHIYVEDEPESMAAHELTQALSETRQPGNKIEEVDDDEWTAFDDSPFGGSSTVISPHAFAGKHNCEDESCDRAPTKVTYASHGSDGSGGTAPPPSSKGSLPDSPTSIADFRREAQATQPQTYSISVDEWNSSSMTEI